jgi:hypothetical protein
MGLGRPTNDRRAAVSGSASAGGSLTPSGASASGQAGVNAGGHYTNGNSGDNDDIGHEGGSGGGGGGGGGVSVGDSNGLLGQVAASGHPGESAGVIASASVGFGDGNFNGDHNGGDDDEQGADSHAMARPGDDDGEGGGGRPNRPNKPDKPNKPDRPIKPDKVRCGCVFIEHAARGVRRQLASGVRSA